MKTNSISNKEMLSEIMKNAHSCFSHKLNTKSWSECLKNAWFAMKLKIRRGFVKLVKKVKPFRFPKVKTTSVSYENYDPWQLGYGRGLYCGD